MSSPKKEIFNRSYGCLLGQTIGDSLGARYEFKTSDEVRSLINRDRSSFRILKFFKGQSSSFLSILPSQRNGMKAGQVTDDTEMAMALARSLQRLKTFDIGDVARSYAIWRRSDPPDIGLTTSYAMIGLPKTLTELNQISNDQIYRLILEQTKKNFRSLSNGCLMRISPLAIAGSRWPLDTLRRAAILDCQLTHSNPIAHDAVAAYVTAIWYLINTGDRNLAYEETLKKIETSQIRRLLDIDDLRVHSLTNQGEEGPLIEGDSKFMGYLGFALKWSFHHLMKEGDDFEKALIDVISLGGDTDTNGCITGALLGSYLGTDQIPDPWKSTVLKATPRRLDKYDWSNMSDSEILVKDLLSIAPPEF